MPWWIFLIAALMHLLSFLWLSLVIHDSNRFVDGQLWVVSDNNDRVIHTPALRWVKRAYVVSFVLWVPLSIYILSL